MTKKFEISPDWKYFQSANLSTYASHAENSIHDENGTLFGHFGQQKSPA